MKLLKFASLLIAVALISTASKAQEIKYRQYNATTTIANFLTDINTVTTEGNWGSELSSPPSPPVEGTNKLFSRKMEVTSGSLPSFANILSAERTYFTTGGNPFPGCGVEFTLTVGSVSVKVTYFCKA